MSFLDELEEKLNSPEFVEKTRKYMEERFAKQEELAKRVSSKEYIDWLYSFVSKNHGVDDDTLYGGVDEENSRLLGVFLDFAEELAVQQRVLVVPDDDCDFDSEKIVVKIKDKYFDIFRMFGQGSWTSVCLLEREPNYAYVKIPY